MRMNSLQLTKREHAAKKVYAIGMLTILGFIGILMFSPLVMGQSVFMSSLLISPDSIDWIIEGRALVLGFEGELPVLRNPAFVVISAVDFWLGGTGVVFAIANYLGLILQITAIHLMGCNLKMNRLVLLALIVSYVMLPIQFISRYVLSDTLAVGLLMVSTALIWMGTQGKNMRIQLVLVGILAALLGSLNQIYVLAPLLTLIVISVWGAVSSPENRPRWVLIGSVSTIAILIFAALKLIWQQRMPHTSVPSQIELLEPSLRMIPFYLNVWFYAFAALAVLTVLLFKRASPTTRLNTWFVNSSVKNLGTIHLIATTAGLFIFSIFYQWPESRFSYSYTGLFYMIFAILLSKFAVDARGLEPTSQGFPLIRSIALGTLVFSLMFTPQNFWTMNLNQVAPFNPWFAASPEELGTKNLVWLDKLSDEPCIDDENRIPGVLVENGVTDLYLYETNVLTFALKNCLL